MKDLNSEKRIENFYEKELWQSKLSMSHYSIPDSHIKDRVKVLL